MKTNSFFIQIAYITTGWLFFLFLLYFINKEGNNNFKNYEINGVHNAINTDYEKRLNNMLVLYYPTREKIKGFEIESEDGVEAINLKDSIHESVPIRLCNQYVLSKILPPSPNEINELLKNELKKSGVGNIKTGIIYSNKGKSFFSNNDSTYYKYLLTLPIEYIDIKKEQSIQAWATIHWIDIIKFISSKSLWSMVAYFIVLFIVSISLIKVKTRKKQLNRDVCIEFGTMILNVESQKLYINGNKCQIAPTDFRLLLLFINAQNNFLTKENIKNKFWPKEENPDSKIHTHISTLRLSIKDYPEYTITTEKNKGYRLNINPDNQIFKFKI